MHHWIEDKKYGNLFREKKLIKQKFSICSYNKEKEKPAIGCKKNARKRTCKYRWERSVCCIYFSIYKKFIEIALRGNVRKAKLI